MKEKIQPSPLEFEYAFVPDFMKGKSFPELVQTLLSLHVVAARDVAAIQEPLYFFKFKKVEPPMHITSASYEETEKPYCEMIPIREMYSSGAGTTKKANRSRHKSDLRTPLDMYPRSYPNTKTLCIARRPIEDNCFIIKGLQTFRGASPTVLSSTSPWRSKAVLTAARRRMQLWRQKRT